MLRKIIKALILLTAFGAVYVYIDLFSSYIFPWDKRDAIQTTIEWGGLATLPVPIKDIAIEKKGSPFTREFIIEFTTSENQLKYWIKKSKKLKDNTPKLKGNKKTYAIHPGEQGSVGGNVEIEGNTVIIDISWS